MEKKNERKREDLSDGVNRTNVRTGIYLLAIPPPSWG